MSAREIPVIFNTAMVKAILDRSKHQTRRPVKNGGRIATMDDDWQAAWGYGHITSPFGSAGDVLWVREAFQLTQSYEETEYVHCNYYVCDSGRMVPERLTGVYDDAQFYYRASFDGVTEDDCAGGVSNDDLCWWRPSIHMPKVACRLKLKVLRVWVERVQSISEDDARAEGCTLTMMSPDGTDNGSYAYDFGYLWDSIYGTWADNPWAWCCEFEVMA